MSPVVKAALAYVSPVFAVAFGLGAVRVTLIAPHNGAVPAVALEIPVVLALGWLVMGRILRRWSFSHAERWGLALLSFGILMLLELLTAISFGQTASQFLSAMTTPAGMLGLAGQIGFALIPLVRQVNG